jgi:hypothetical protein
VQALLGGRARVELSAEKPSSPSTGPAQLSGWDDHDRPPIFLYPPFAADEG